MRHRRRLAVSAMSILAAISLAAWAPSLRADPPKASPAKALDAEATLAQARAAYANLAGKGFKRYQFVATPDWAAILAGEAKTNPEGYAAAMKLFAKVRFEVLVGPKGDAQVSHNVVDSPNPETTAGLNQVYSGMEQTLSGFFQTWTPFMVDAPFPPAGHPVRIQDAGSHYQVAWEEEGDTKVDLKMDKAFVIQEMRVKSPAIDSSIRPTFERQVGGLVLAGYDADFRTAASSMRLKVLITNRAIQELPLPVALDLTVWNAGTRQQILMAFSEMKVEKL